METTKFILEEKEMPTAWYNVLPDLPKPTPGKIKKTGLT